MIKNVIIWLKIITPIKLERYAKHTPFPKYPFQLIFEV